MTTQKIVLDSMPDVSIVGVLPTLPDESVLVPCESTWQKAEREWALGLMATAAIRHGNWYPIDTQTFIALLEEKKAPWSIFPERVVNTIWELVDEGYMDIITVDDCDYILPKQALADELAKCGLRYA
jgi:hypothetical protein